LNQAIVCLEKLENCRAQGTFERLERLGPTIWREPVQAALFRYIALLPGHDCSLTEVTDLLAKYEYWEPQALLELAVWKSECIKQMPKDKVDFLGAQQWIYSGWKALKKEHRDSNAISIVVSMVRPFLDPLITASRMVVPSVEEISCNLAHHQASW
jgi:hypothetical protein